MEPIWWGKTGTEDEDMDEVEDVSGELEKVQESGQ